MATLYLNTLDAIIYQLMKEFPNEYSLTHLPSLYAMVDKSYVRWEKSGGVDHQLPSFKLTNRQMLWLCIAHKYSAKYHKDVITENNEYQVTIDKLHIFVKQNEGFREAFKCGNLTINEEKQIEELEKKSKRCEYSIDECIYHEKNS